MNEEQQQQQQQPLSTKNNLDTKIVAISAVDSFLRGVKSTDGMEMDSGVKLVILTSFGTISGTIADHDEDSPFLHNEGSSYSISVGNIIHGLRSSAIIDHEKEVGPDNVKLLNHSGYVELVDAVITPYANQETKIHMKSLVLFADQISGITLGTSQN